MLASVEFLASRHSPDVIRCPDTATRECSDGRIFQWDGSNYCHAASLISSGRFSRDRKVHHVPNRVADVVVRNARLHRKTLIAGRAYVDSISK